MILDLILLVMLGLAAFNGWRSGAIAMVLAIVVLIAAVLLATSFAGQVGSFLGVGPTWARPVVGFAFGFLVLMIAGSWIKHFFSPKTGILRGFDGIAGAALGLIRGFLVLSFLIGIFNIFHLPPERTTERSHVYPVLLRTSTILVGVLRPYIHTDKPNSSISI